VSDRIHRDVMEALGTVLDPCSVFNRTNLSLIELGMVDEVTVSEEGRVHIRLFLDDPTCIFFFEIHRMLQEAVSEVEGVGEIEVEIKADEIWTEERMSHGGRTRLNRIRRERREAHGRDGAAAPGWPLPMVPAEAATDGPALPMAGKAGA
jgi:metal-sulfur cluster biosynthetic enzyme